MAWPVYLSLRPVAEDEWAFSVTIGATTEVLEVAEGRYYNDSIVAAESLAAAIQDALNTHSAIGGNPFTVLYDLETGEFTISRTGNFGITWTVTSFRDWVGFSGNVSGGASYTSDQVAQGTIFADSGRSMFPGRQYHYQVGQTRSQAGPVALIGTGVETVTSLWQHQLEPVEGVASPLASGSRDDSNSVVPWTWLDFFRHHLQFYVGEPFRFYAESTDSLNDWEDEYQLVDTDAFDPAWGEPEVAVYCTIRMTVADYVVSS